MKTFFFAGLLLASLVSFAQDSTKVPAPNPEFEKNVVNQSISVRSDSQDNYNYRLYNYTSQSLNNFFNTELRAANRIAADFDYSGNSNAVPATLALNFVFKAPISKALKDRADSRVRNQLKLEDNLRTGIAYQHRFAKWGGTFYLAYYHREMRNISGKKDAYQLLMYGNARFEGDSADLSNVVFQNFIYNQYSAGIKKTVTTGKYQLQFGAGLSFLQVINSQDIRTNRASLYTAPDGEYIDINYDLRYNSAKEGATHFFQLNGAGISGDLNMAISNADKWKLAIDVSDIGTMSFRKSPVNYSGKNSVHFQGIVIPDLTSFSSQTFDTLSIDSALLGNLPKKTHNRFSTAVPFTASVVFSKPLLKNKLVLSAALQYRNIETYYLYGYIKANYFIKPDMVFSGSLGAGGYSLFNVGVEFSKAWKYFDFSVGSSNLVGLVLPSHYTGTSVYLRLVSSFLKKCSLPSKFHQ